MKIGSLSLFFLFLSGFAQTGPSGPAKPSPNVVIISVDTLRADRLSGYGYARNTSPNIDKLMSKGVKFTQARTIEPLTAPALASMITSRYPHDHGASRNGLPIYEGLPSVTKQLAGKGYRTAALVSNWTLRDGLLRLGEHFDQYEEVFTRKRYLGLFLSEADAEDLTDESLKWMQKNKGDQPFFLWVHYVEPHGPYRLQKPYLEQLKLPKRDSYSASDRYDSEIAFNDDEIGRLLRGVYAVSPEENTLIVFVSDHGESLGEHNYWGHGRHLYEPTLHIPMSITWPGRIAPQTVSAPALITDIPTTILTLTHTPVPPEFIGFDWTPVLDGKAKQPMERVTYFQAHKGAVQTKMGPDRRRQKGLLELAVMREGNKEIFHVKHMSRKIFDLQADPLELHNIAEKGSKISQALMQWALEVERGLHKAMERPDYMTDRDLEMMRSLGYIE